MNEMPVDILQKGLFLITTKRENKNFRLYQGLYLMSALQNVCKAVKIYEVCLG
jgi:hypothetical protein